MAIIPTSEVRRVYGITSIEEKQIKAFMQGAIYAWLNIKKDQPFAVRDLVGAENADWRGTPLQALYEKHIKLGKQPDEAAEAAAKDLGWFTKAVLAEDKRTFLVGKAGLVSSYAWVRQQAADHGE